MSKRYSAIIHGQKVTITEEELQQYRLQQQMQEQRQRQVHHHHYHDEADTQMKAFFGFLLVFIGIFVAGMGMHALHQERTLRPQTEVRYGR